MLEQLFKLWILQYLFMFEWIYDDYKEQIKYSLDKRLIISFKW